MSVVASCARAPDRPPVGTHAGPGRGGVGRGGRGEGERGYILPSNGGMLS